MNPCPTARGRRFCPRLRLRPLLPVFFAVLAAVAAPTLHAQEEGSPVLRGEVLRHGEPLREGMVVLHHVTPGEAGEVDSVSVSTEGRFELTLPRMPNPDSRSEVYFGSVRHLGILYFGPAIADPAQLDSVYSIEVFDTTSAPPDGAEITVSVRNLFIEEVEDGWQATDLFQLRNDTDRTFVSREGARGPDPSGDSETPRDGSVWSYPLPPGASDFQVGQSDLPPDAVAFEGSTVHVSAPLPPGERLYLVRYLLPDIEFDLPMPGNTEVMELLILEPVPPVQVSGLQADQSVELEPGSTYRRFAATDLTDVMVTLSAAEEEGTLPMAWLAVILALVLGMAGIFAVGKRPAPAGGANAGFGRGQAPTTPAGPGPGPGLESGPKPGPGNPARDPAVEGRDARAELLRRIAALDEDHAGAGPSSPREEAQYRAEREALKERLRSLR